ncbi:respiratory nitrate reductase 2 subunit delta [Escherichia coli]|uniref:Respiratory nitrate reductase 2 subunit delta n=1 Tax=Escherichia coli TaxID=562 RepID=A0A376S6F0_ECOLX|nr:respiratory nitrate reductase 2 subunit delta [Escherichia coli]
MVDLLAEYERSACSWIVGNCPIIYRCMLEYLSVLPDDQAKEGLLNVAPILALLGGRLKQREAPWYALFDTLLQLAGSTLSSDSVTKQVNSEERDDTARHWMRCGKRNR